MSDRGVRCAYRDRHTVFFFATGAAGSNERAQPEPLVSQPALSCPHVLKNRRTKSVSLVF